MIGEGVIKIGNFKSMKLLLSLVLLFCGVFTGFSQNQMLVYFTDKADTYVELTERAEERRIKNSVTPDERDKIVKPEYLEALSASGNIKNVSRWLNAVSFDTPLTPDELLETYDFIDHIHLIASTENRVKKTYWEKDTSTPLGVPQFRSTDYGVVEGQIKQINADCLHDSGYNGEGIYVAVLDAGFRGMDTVDYFDPLWAESRVLDTFNFVHSDSTIFKYSGHGTAVSSCIVAEKPGTYSYYGTAIDASLALYVTEDVSSETLVEEFNLVTALERCDVQGVDIANISLGYRLFDDTLENHAYEDLDGETTIAAIGVNTAATKGILVVNSAGNSGPEPISTPCDADSCLCVGAVNVEGLFAPFSSLGPSSDGQVKPDVATTGWKAWVIIDNNWRVKGNGTSFSSPLMAGGIACLMQANPSATVMEVIAAVQESGSIYDSPSIAIGYGIPDLCDADKVLGGNVSIPEDEKEALSVFPNPANEHLQITGLNAEKEYQFELVNQVGQVVYSSLVSGTTVHTINLPQLSNGIYFVRVNGVHLEKVLISKL